MAKTSKALRKPFFPWQDYVAAVGNEIDLDTGTWAYDLVLVLAQRRAGKTVLIEPTVMHRCSQPDPISAWITAQKRDNAVKRWRDATDVMMRSSFRHQLHRTVSNAHEAMTWKATGSKFLPFAPDEDSMHGEDPDLVFGDEIWAHSLEAMRKIQQGYRPAWSVKTGQEWLMSAAGSARSAALKAFRRRGRAAVEAGVRSGIAYFEFCVPEVMPDGTPVAELPDDQLVAVVLANHPRRDHGLRPAFLVEELATMGRPGFLRAYGGLDEDESVEETVIPLGVLTAAFTPDRIPERVRVAFGLHVDEGRRETTISAAWRDAGGRGLTQVIDSRPGSSWAAARVAELVESNAGGNPVGSVAVLGAGMARGIADELDRAGVPVIRVSAVDQGAACGVVEDQLADGRLTHDNDGRMLAAFRAAGWRQMGRSRVWASNTGEPITVLDSHTLAVWGFDHMPDPEPIPVPFEIR